MRNPNASRPLIIMATAVVIAALLGGAIILGIKLNPLAKAATDNKTNKPAESAPVAKYEYALTGKCVPDFEKGDFEVEDCTLIEKTTNTKIDNFIICNEDGAIGDNICANTYSTVKLGKQPVGFPYVYISGGEGGDDWLDVYKINAENGKFQLESVYSNNVSLTGMTEYLKLKPGCKDFFIADYYYRLNDSCIANYDKLTSSQKEELKSIKDFEAANLKYVNNE
jgi:hypothetical protein